MKLALQISDGDVKAVQAFFERYEKTPIVQQRKAQNVDGVRKPLTPERFWRFLVSRLLTTQQPSGPQDPISRFNRTTPFPLALDKAKTAKHVESWVADTLRGFGGIRRYNTLARDIGFNLEMFDTVWVEVQPVLARLERDHTKDDERTAARLLDDRLAGVGPKQARNLLQGLGLAKYETPLDSRVGKWLRTLGYPFPMSAAALSDPQYYELALNGFQELSEKAGILPCLLDAAVFASFDREWQESELY